MARAVGGLWSGLARADQFTPAPGSPFAVGSQPDAVTTGDFNADGYLDAAVTNQDARTVTDLIGKRIRLPGHFAGVVRLEGAERLDGAYQLRVRTESGTLDETLITDEDLAGEAIEPVDDHAIRKLVAACHGRAALSQRGVAYLRLPRFDSRLGPPGRTPRGTGHRRHERRWDA